MKELIDNLLKLQALVSDLPAGGSKDDQIAKLRAKIPAPVLAHYDRLVSRGKKGVAAVRNQVCTGCHMQVPLAVTMTLMHGDDIRICESCGRYLYLAPVVEPAPAAAPEPKREKKAAGGKRGRQLQAV
jgi:predicted  nucleic acid-binding Zn-ribbon protein